MTQAFFNHKMKALQNMERFLKTSNKCMCALRVFIICEREQTREKGLRMKKSSTHSNKKIIQSQVKQG